MNWQALIQGSRTPAFRKKIAEIADTLCRHIQDFKDNNGIVADRLGVVLFLFYYSRFTGEEEYADIAFDLLSLVFDEVNEDLERGIHDHSSNRLAGVGWVLEHVRGMSLIDIDCDDILEPVDPLLADLMLIELEKHNFDGLTGALHKGIYFLNRLRHGAVRDYLARLVDGLEKVCQSDGGDGLFVPFQLPGNAGPEPGIICDLGLAHGMPGIAWFLAKMTGEGIQEEKSRILSRGFVTYILGQAREIPTAKSYFPMMAVTEGSKAANTRLGWCYGDLGIGIALLQALAKAGDGDWKDKVIHVLLHAARRREIEGNGVVDAGMCHGTAGIAHIFSRAYFYTGMEEFKEAALYWYDETMKMASFEDGYAGFKCWKGKDGGWVLAADLFDGVSGIGLALLSALSGIAPGWDRLLMLS